MTKLAPDRWLYVYALKDPRTMQVRYVGSSVNLKGRMQTLANHAKHSRSGRPKAEWVNELKLAGMAPIMIPLERVQEVKRLEREAWWIQFYQQSGADLVNTIEHASHLTKWRNKAESEQTRVYGFIRDYIDEHGQAPLNTEIAAGTDITYIGVQPVLAALVDLGLISKGRKHRSIYILDSSGNPDPLIHKEQRFYCCVCGGNKTGEPAGIHGDKYIRHICRSCNGIGWKFGLYGILQYPDPSSESKAS